MARLHVHHGIDSLSDLPPGVVLSIGNFDGLHRGHRAILSLAASLRGPAGVAVITFEPHPLTVLRPASAPPRLSPLPVKEALLSEAGVDHLVVLPPAPEVLGLTAEQFWSLVRDGARPAHVIEGESFSFGKNRGGTIQRLAQWTAENGVKLHVVNPVRVPLLDCHVVPVSSSLVRWLLLEGRVRDAAIALGRAYALQGTVVKGFQRGREIGIPTANLDCGEQLVPADGVYIGRAAVGGRTYPAALSIGTMPTFGQHQQQVEAHLIGFDGDLYGKRLCVEIVDWLRDQWKFPSVESLLVRMRVDVAMAEKRAAAEGVSEPIVSIAAASSSDSGAANNQ